MQKYQIFIDKGLITETDVDKALDSIRRSRLTLGDLAKQRGFLTSRQILKVLNQQALSTKPFGEIAIEMGFLSKEQVSLLIDEQERKSMPFIRALKINGVRDDVLDKIQELIDQGICK